MNNEIHSDSEIASQERMSTSGKRALTKKVWGTLKPLASDSLETTEISQNLKYADVFVGHTVQTIGI